MSKLSQSTIEKLGYYVYLLIDPRDGKPFYVGKGYKNRINSHDRDALRKIGTEKKKIQTINNIKKTGYKPKLVVLRHGLTEKEALEIESATIDLIGIKNLTNLVSGHYTTDRGLMSLDDIKIKYEAEPAYFKEPAMLINIRKLYHPVMTPEELYEATRKSWPLSIKNASTRKIVCSVYKGIIREVYIAERWLPDPNRIPRIYFEGTIAPPKIRNKYIHKSVKNYVKYGNQNPVRYVG